MAKLSVKETVDGVLNGSISKVSRTDALALLKDLGFKDMSHKQRQDRYNAYSGVMMMKHKDIEAYVPVSRDSFLKEAELVHFKKTVAEITAKTTEAK